jgi:hypothetical protein
MRNYRASFFASSSSIESRDYYIARSASTIKYSIRQKSEERTHMGRDRKDPHNGWYPEDEDRYVENRYIHEDEYNDDIYDDYDDRHARPQRASRRPSSSTSRRRYPEDEPDYRRVASRPRVMRKVQPTRKRRVWPILLAGCGIGFILAIAALALSVLLGIDAIQNGGHITGIPGLPTNQSFSQTETQSLALTQISNVLVCDKIGNVSMKVDPNATKTTVTAVKTVQATNAANAQTLLKQVAVEIQPPATSTQALSCTTPQSAGTATSNTTPTATTTPTTTTNALTINVTLPQVTNNQVDLTITVPPIAMQSDQNPLTVAINAPRGNIDVAGISGKMLLQGDTGNITVTKAVLTNGSQLQTSAGNITFSGFLLVPTDTNAQDVSYMLSNETGNINVTLPANTAVMLSAYTNIGTISSAFPLKTSNQGGSITYNGPLNSSVETSTSATLILHLSSGNVHIQKSN